MDENKLLTVIKQQEVSKDSAARLLEEFGVPLTEAGEIINELYVVNEEGEMELRDDALKVTEITQTDLMKEARVKRLTLRNIRSGVENKRKELKEDSLRTGRVIDAVAKYLETTIRPVEQYLEQQEKFAELKIAEEKAKLHAERLEALAGYEVDLAMYNIDVMSPDQFNGLVAELEEKKQRAEAEAKAEAERIEKERLEREAEERKIREENERLRREAAEREAAERAEREQAEAEERERREIAEKEQARVDNIASTITSLSTSIETKQQVAIALGNLNKLMAKLSQADKENTTIKLAHVTTETEITNIGRNIDDLAKQREEAERAERESRERAEQAEREAREKQEALEAQLKAEQAPDAEKLRSLASGLAIVRNEKLPAMSSQKGRETMVGIEEKLDDLLKFIAVSVDEL